MHTVVSCIPVGTLVGSDFLLAAPASVIIVTAVIVVAIVIVAA
jgi:hypothetical protein